MPILVATAPDSADLMCLLCSLVLYFSKPEHLACSGFLGVRVAFKLILQLAQSPHWGAITESILPIDVQLAKLRCWEREGDGWRGRSGKREVSVGVRSPRQSFSRGAMRKRWEQEAQEGRKDEKKAFRGCKWVEVKRECWVVVVGGVVWQGGCRCWTLNQAV